MRDNNWQEDFDNEGEAWIKLPVLASLRYEFHRGAPGPTALPEILDRVIVEYRRRGGLTEEQAIAFVEAEYPELDLDRDDPVFRDDPRGFILGCLEDLAEDAAGPYDDEPEDEEQEDEREVRQSQGYIRLRDEEGFLESVTSPLQRAVKALAKNEKQIVENILHRFETDFVTKEDLEDIGPPEYEKVIRNMVACSEIIVCEEVAADVNYLAVWFSVAWDDEHEYTAILHGARVVDLLDSGAGWSDPDHPRSRFDTFPRRRKASSSGSG